MTDRITEKKLKNKRFRNTEETIIATLLTTKELLSPSRLIKIAGISRSTLYRHHQNVHEIIPDYERYISRRFKTNYARLMKIGYIRLRFLYEQIFPLLLANQPIIKLILQHDNRSFTEQIIAILKPKILTVARISDGEAFRIYAKEVAALVEAWCNNGFKRTEINPTVDKIMYLTSTAHTRLSPLVQFDHPNSKTQNK